MRAYGYECMYYNEEICLSKYWKLSSSNRRSSKRLVKKKIRGVFKHQILKEILLDNTYT